MGLEEHRHLNVGGFARRQRAAELEDRIAALASHLHAATYRLLLMLRLFDRLGGLAFGRPLAAVALRLFARCGAGKGARGARPARLAVDSQGLQAG